MAKRIVKDGKHTCAGFEVETENGAIVRIWAGENNAACPFTSAYRMATQAEWASR